MDAFIANNLTGLIQTVAIVCGIILFLKRVPSKQEVDRGDDILRADIREIRKQFNELVAKLDKNFQALSDKIDATNDKIDATAKAFNDKIEATNDKIDATAKTFNDKIDETAKTLNDKIDLLGGELRSDIRELNRDYKEHITYHALHDRLDAAQRESQRKTVSD